MDIDALLDNTCGAIQDVLAWAEGACPDCRDALHDFRAGDPSGHKAVLAWTQLCHAHFPRAMAVMCSWYLPWLRRRAAALTARYDQEEEALDRFEAIRQIDRWIADHPEKAARGRGKQDLYRRMLGEQFPGLDEQKLHECHSITAQNMVYFLARIEQATALLTRDGSSSVSIQPASWPASEPSMPSVPPRSLRQP